MKHLCRSQQVVACFLSRSQELVRRVCDVPSFAPADIITLTKSNCATRMTYYQELLTTLLVFKGVLLLVLLLSSYGPILISLVKRKTRGNAGRRRRPSASTEDRRRDSIVTSDSNRSAAPTTTGTGAGNGTVAQGGRRRQSVTQAALAAAQRCKINWMKVFRVESMILFVAYPSVSVKILKIFRCTQVGWRSFGVSLLASLLPVFSLSSVASKPALASICFGPGC